MYNWDYYYFYYFYYAAATTGSTVTTTTNAINANILPDILLRYWI